MFLTPKNRVVKNYYFLTYLLEYFYFIDINFYQNQKQQLSLLKG